MTDDEKLKAKEDWLRQELRALRTLMTSVLQWGVAVLSAVELKLYDIRRDVAKHFADQGHPTPDNLVPLPRWLVGTALLTILAYIFTRYLSRFGRHHRAYRNQLIEMDPSYSGITEGVPVGGAINRQHFYLFFIFPIFDIALWAFFYVGDKLKFTITFPW